MQQETSNSFTLFCVFFKPFICPNIDYIKPIQAGKKVADFDLGFEGDDGADNISEWNKNFSELTVLYHIWKNYKPEQIRFWGLCSYRRYFTLPKNILDKKRIQFYPIEEASFNKIFTPKLKTVIENKLNDGYIILPKKYKFIKLKKWSVKQQYIKDHDTISWQLTEDAVKKLYPEYMQSVNEFMNGLTASWYNMLIASNEFWNGYLTFLFNILFEIKKTLVVQETPALSRIYGNIAERLLNAYVLHHQKLGQKVYYLPVAELKNNS